MRKNSQIRKLENIIFACFFCFAVVFAISVYSFVKLNTARKQNAMYDEEIKKMEYQNTNLNNSVENMKTTDYVENEARENLGLVKDGETVYYYN